MADDDAIRARLALMSDDELRRMVSVERKDYVPRALDLAESELVRRSAVGQTAPQLAPTEKPSPKNAWIDIWAAMLATSAIGNVLGRRSQSSA
jgi:hypothetical protein